MTQLNRPRSKGQFDDENPSHENTSLKLTGQIVGHTVPNNRLGLATSHFRRENKKSLMNMVQTW